MSIDDRAVMTGLARISRMLVDSEDPVGIITAGLLEACHSVSADAGGVLVRSTDDHLDVLAATSHRVRDLEVHQAATEDGPCVESMRIGELVAVDSVGADERWPGFGERMRTAGYDRIFAVPMRWQGVGIGGLNVFWKPAEQPAPVDVELLQTFADMLTLAALHVRPMSIDDATRRLRETLEKRNSVEQAKGVLAWQHGLDMVGAYAALMLLAQHRNLTLGEAADTVVAAAQRGDIL